MHDKFENGFLLSNRSLNFINQKYTFRKCMINLKMVFFYKIDL